MFMKNLTKFCFWSGICVQNPSAPGLGKFWISKGILKISRGCREGAGTIFFLLGSIWAPAEHYIWKFLSKTEQPNLSTFWDIDGSEHVNLTTFFKQGLIWAPWSEHYCKNCSYLRVWSKHCFKNVLIWALLFFSTKLKL